MDGIGAAFHVGSRGSAGTKAFSNVRRGGGA
jgi:hypothetical protein